MSDNRENAKLLVKSIMSALAHGTRHYSFRSGARLHTVEEVLDALIADGQVVLVFPSEEGLQSSVTERQPIIHRGSEAIQ